MKKIPASTISSMRVHTYLYRVVFMSAWSATCVVILIASFFLQTVERAFANESLPVEQSPIAPLITDDLIDRVESEAVPIAIERSVGEQVEPPISEFESESDVIPERSQSATPTSTDQTAETVKSNESPPIDTSQEILNDSPPAINPVSTSSLLFEGSIETSSTTTEEFVDVTSSSTPTLTVESDQMLQFNKNNCVAVEDGSFYCQKASTTAVVADEGLYAFPDEDGDLELFLKRADELRQLTFNTVDDASPYYDPASDTIVWHRFIDERYQIMVMDVASGEETQLTDTSTNNMEAFRSDNIIVWQFWANNAWQIMFYDGSSITQLTDTTEHNLAPVVRNGLVVWHRITNGVKTIEVYDISTASFMTIEDEGGGTVTNPRMVLVFDSTMDNGDVVTKGYDLVTGEITDFAAEPAPLPDEIPTPDPIEEARALVQSKSSGREGGEVADGDDLGIATSTEPDISPVATTTVSNVAGTTLTLDLSTSTVQRVENVVLVPQVADIPDLVIAPYTATSSHDTDTVVE